MTLEILIEKKTTLEANLLKLKAKTEQVLLKIAEIDRRIAAARP